VTIWNDLAQMYSTMGWCASTCLTKVTSRLRWHFKVKLMCPLYISFEPLMGFTNNSAHMSSKMRWPISVQGEGQSSRLNSVRMVWAFTKFNNYGYHFNKQNGIHHFLDSSSLWSHLYVKQNRFHPMTYGGRHECFRFRKHQSCLI